MAAPWGKVFAARLFCPGSSFKSVPLLTWAGVTTTAAYVGWTSSSHDESAPRTACEAATRPANLQKRLTPIGHFAVISETMKNPSINVSFMTLSQPLTAAELSKLWTARQMTETHPRFGQVVSRTNPSYFVEEDGQGTEHPKEPLQHISETFFSKMAAREDLSARLRHLQSSTWSLSDSLWHIYLAPWQKPADPKEKPSQQGHPHPQPTNHEETRGGGIIVLKAHHALGDGASLSAAIMDLADEAEQFRALIRSHLRARRQKFTKFWDRVYHRLLQLWWFIWGSFQALLYHAKLSLRSFWEPNPWRIIERLSETKKLDRATAATTTTTTEAERTLSWTVAAPVNQVKFVAQQLGGSKATINDVFAACVSAAVAKQLEYHRQRLLAIHEESTPLPRQRHFNIAFPVHLTGGVLLPGQSLGNNIGGFVVQTPGEVDSDRADTRFQAVHRELAYMKQTPAALLSYLVARSVSTVSALLPHRAAAWIYEQANDGTVAVISNNRGPEQPIHLAGRRVESMQGFVPLPPGIPLGIVVLSYAGKISVSVSAEKWAVPDADQFLMWMLEEYLQLLDLARAASQRKELA